MNNLFARLADQSGRALSEVRQAWRDAKKAAKKKGFRAGGPAFTQHALEAVKKTCAPKTEQSPETSAQASTKESRKKYDSKN
jgi:hypothetical protein